MWFHKTYKSSRTCCTLTCVSVACDHCSSTEAAHFLVSATVLYAAVAVRDIWNNIYILYSWPYKLCFWSAVIPGTLVYQLGSLVCYWCCFFWGDVGLFCLYCHNISKIWSNSKKQTNSDFTSKQSYIRTTDETRVELSSVRRRAIQARFRGRITLHLPVHHFQNARWPWTLAQEWTSLRRVVSRKWCPSPLFFNNWLFVSLAQTFSASKRRDFLDAWARHVSLFSVEE